MAFVQAKITLMGSIIAFGGGFCQAAGWAVRQPPFKPCGLAIMRGDIPAKWYASLEEAREDLGV